MKLNSRRMMNFILLGAIGISATLLAIYLLSRSATKLERVSPYFNTLLVVIVAGLALLLFVTIWQIIYLVRRLMQHSSGARLSLSFALRILFAALLPVAIIGSFSWAFLSYDLGETFNSRISSSLEDALQLTRATITLHARQALDQTRQLSNTMIRMNYTDLVSEIEFMRRTANAIELSVFDQQGNIVAFAHRNLEVMSIDPPSQAALIRIAQEQDYFEFIASNSDDYAVKVLTNINKLGRDPFYLQAIYAMPADFNSLADSIRENYQQYQSYKFLQPHITTSLLLVLGIILALTILAACWISALFGEQMTRPVQQLIDGTRKVITGDFSSPITDMPNNDLGILGNNFNAMLLTLRDAEQKNITTQGQLTEQNNFLETILDNITAGVITLDAQLQLKTINRAAFTILDTDISKHLACVLPSGTIPSDSFEELILSIHEMLTAGVDVWTKEIVLNKFGQRKIIICHGSRILDLNNTRDSGQVVVFEDVTEFQQSQRNAAWEEVARRLAHEIKNPLTPIRLQSERLQRKLTDKLDADSQHILTRATTTIINQVDAMQQIVGDFSQFARPITLRRHVTDVTALLKEVSELYPEVLMSFEFKPAHSIVQVDPVQLRQVLHNLIKNAIEAAIDIQKIQIRWTATQTTDLLIVSIEDNGPGFPDLDRDPFEPYVTNKSKGTGLGLAIVKKIINEHNGTIHLGHSKLLGGAKITFTLPL